MAPPLRTLLALSLLLSLLPCIANAETPHPPGQPTSGPGGASYAYAAVDAERFGDEPTGGWTFTPVTGDGKPVVEPMPLVIFLHGFSAVDPVAYRAWIDHLVRRGAVVVYPDYQHLALSGLKPGEYLADAVAGIETALARLDTAGWRIDPARVAVIGHSVGGVLALNLAVIAGRTTIPPPTVVFAVEPGGCTGCGRGPSALGVPLLDLASVPTGTLVALLIGDADDVVGDAAARLAWNDLADAGVRRDFVTLHGDEHGRPALAADHLAPLTAASGELDALDWFGLWKTFDLLTACGFARSTCSGLLDPALAGDARAMGEWSDGVPVTPLEIDEAS